MQIKTQFEKALDYYFKKDFIKAQEIFESLINL
jgi:hypothetical protein